MGAQTDRLRSQESAQTKDADKAALETEPNWDRMGQIAKRLMATKPDPKATGKSVAPKRPKVARAEAKGI